MTAKHIQEAWDKLRQERDELAARLAAAEQRSEEMVAQVEVMRSTVDKFINGITDSICSSGNDAGTNIWYIRRLKSELAPPSTAATILRQRDARTLREAAGICSGLFEGQVGMAHVVSVRCAVALNTKAAELERKNG